jgi:hypothetical protein
MVKKRSRKALFFVRNEGVLGANRLMVNLLYEFDNLINSANVNDSLMCCYIGGCIDPAATNYDPNACFNNISCNFLINNIFHFNKRKKNGSFTKENPNHCRCNVQYDNGYRNL